MRRISSFQVTLTAMAVTLVAAACADPISAPRRIAADQGPSLTVGPLQPIPAGSTVIQISSSASTQYCGFNATLAPTFATVFAGGCVAAFDLNTNGALAAYNPGWPLVPHIGSDWIGPQADANRYRVLPGTYDFRTTFNLPTGATAPLLNLSSLADNVAIVYLNGVEVGRNTPTQDCPAGGPCNWTSTLTMYDNVNAQFVIGGTNTLDVFLIDTPIGFGPVGFNNGSSCAQGPQASSPLPDKLPSQGGTWDVATCKNPAGVNFWGTVSYTPAPPPPRPVALFVIGDVEAHGVGANVNFWGSQWWKHNQMSGVTSNGYESFKGYAVTSDNVCGGTWTSLPGNSSNPPATIGADIAIIVTSKVLKSGNNNISGDIKQIVIVHQDGGYGPNPGHDGNGPVTSIVCTAP